MTNYVQMEPNFIERTVKILDQYGLHVKGNVPPRKEYEVTLLMNCMLGLLIYPQQIANLHQWNDWLKSILVVNLDSSWGLCKEHIYCAGHKLVKKEGKRIELPIEVGELALRNTLRQMRNTAAHASFKVHDSGEHRGDISHIIFHDEREHGFHLVLPVNELEKFVRKLAGTAIQKLEHRKSNT